MPDREKVIKGLEHCFHGQECCGDIECPYYIEHLSDSCCLEECQENLKEDIIALLKEQETANIYKCQNCGTWVSAENVVRCKDCCHWKPPHIRLNDGKQRAYKPGDKDNDPLGIGVSCDIGINVGGKCWLDYKTGYGEDKRVFRGENDFCSRADKLPEGMTSEQYWGLSEEPSELRDDFDY